MISCGILLIRQIMLKMHENFVKSDSYKNGKDSDMFRLVAIYENHLVIQTPEMMPLFMTLLQNDMIFM